MGLSKLAAALVALIFPLHFGANPALRNFCEAIELGVIPSDESSASASAIFITVIDGTSNVEPVLHAENGCELLIGQCFFDSKHFANTALESEIRGGRHRFQFQRWLVPSNALPSPYAYICADRIDMRDGRTAIQNPKNNPDRRAGRECRQNYPAYSNPWPMGGDELLSRKFDLFAGFTRLPVGVGLGVSQGAFSDPPQAHRSSAKNKSENAQDKGESRDRVVEGPYPEGYASDWLINVFLIGGGIAGFLLWMMSIAYGARARDDNDQNENKKKSRTDDCGPVVM